MKKQIKICDTTLRDGEQMPGVVFYKKQKISLAKKISEFGVDFIELMPAISKSELETTEYLLESGMKNKIIASTLLRKKDIKLAKSIGLQNITLFTSLSDIHLNKKLNLSRKDNLEKTKKHIDYAKELGLNINFAGEDSSRANMNYILDFINALGDKIDYFYFCDTMGVLTPKKTYDIIKLLQYETDCKIGLHFHNDFGQATSNTLEGLIAGADLFSGTFIGIGERAGNAPVEEVVTSLKYLYNKELPIKFFMIGEICKIIEKYSGIKMQKHKPISGENAFAHESGIHVDGILKDPRNYENFNPEIIGRKRKILFGKHSGINGLKYILGDKLDDETYLNILNRIKSVAEKEKIAFSEKELLEIIKKWTIT